MKKHKYAKMFLTELETMPNISVACKRVGLSRQTVYRWCREDNNFEEKLNDALTLGVESMVDLAESKLLANVSGGNQRAIETALDYYGKRSERNKPKSSDDPYKGKSLADLLMAASEAKRNSLKP
jgi:hypothetical protein